MSVPQKVLELVDLFRRNADAYHAPQYNEAMVRQEFINPSFKCLGWDMDNEQGYAEAYKDVIHEAAIKIGGAIQNTSRGAESRVSWSVSAHQNGR